jgi:hypothetical protein
MTVLRESPWLNKMIQKSKAMGEALLDFTGLEDLKDWLKMH